MIKHISLNQKEVINVGIAALCRIQFGAFRTKMGLFSSCMIKLKLFIVIVRSNLSLNKNDTSSKEPDLKESTKRKFFTGKQRAWKNSLKPVFEMTAPVIGITLEDKTKDPHVAQPTTKSLKSISGGRILSFTDMYGNGFRLKVMWFFIN